jgi:molybdopterin/thiamine biosynthesis adenylyltransferase
MEELLHLYKKIYSVLLPTEFVQNKYVGGLKGILIENTGVFNVLSPSFQHDDKRIGHLGEIVDSRDSKLTNDAILRGEWNGDLLTFFYKGEKIEWKTYSIESDIASRNKGIVDNIHLRDSYAVIVGCGSVGSFIALELAKGGVGNFILVDNDIFAYHNISRHQCGILDVGKRKVDALEERLHQINPLACIKKYFSTIQDVFVDELKDYLLGKNGIIINCGDNRLSSYYSNSLAIELNLYFLSACASYMAAYGELFWYVPQYDMPCYGCVYGDNYNVSNNNETIRHWYAGEEQLAKEDFIPALSVDIDYISIIATKFALDLLMLTFPSYEPRYIQHSTPFMFISNFLLKDANMDAFGISEPLQVVKTKTQKRTNCLLCSKK